MSKFDKRVVRSVPPVASTTSCESGQGRGLEQYVWDPTRRPKQDPFFAVHSIVMDLPRISLTNEDDTKVSITF